jgi:Zn-dependent protease
MVEMSLTQQIAVSILPILFAITLHEVAHGWVASLYGDQTARLSGRLTLNPIKHIDLVGTIIVPLLMFIFIHFIFGWAKPVPVDARNMRNPRWNMIVVALAGPLSNIVMGLIWAAIAKIGMLLIPTGTAWLGQPLFWMGIIGININVVFAVLNLLPIPPLDGGRVLMNILPPRMAWKLQKYEQYLFIILVILLVSGILSNIILPPIILLTQGITDLFNLSAYPI